MGTFSERLRELRGTESQASFAASIGVNRVQYAKYESGQNSPSIELLKRICEAHDGVTADWLLGLSKSAAKTAAPGTSHLTHGERPDCAGCPYKEQMKKFEKLFASTTKTKGKRK